MEIASKSKLTPSPLWNDTTTIQDANWTQKKMDRMHNRSLVPRTLVNVSNVERLASVGLGSMMAVIGLRKKSLGGAIATIIGGGLLYRGFSGDCKFYEALGINTANKKQTSAASDSIVGITPFGTTEDTRSPLQQ